MSTMDKLAPSSKFPSPTEINARPPIITGLLLAQLCSLLPLFAMSAYVLRVMCTTSILHLNLRLLFMWHTVAAMMFGLGIFSLDVLNLLHPQSSRPFTPTLVQLFLVRFGIIANVLVTPILVAERIVATLYVKSYEHRLSSGSYLLYTSMVLVLTLAAGVVLHRSIYHTGQATTLMTFVLVTANVGTSIIAYLVLLVVLRYNERSYQMDLHSRDGHNLSERYQRSENIRTSRQLLPITLLHVLQNISPCLFLCLTYVGAIAKPDELAIFSGINGLVTCWFYLALQIAIIMFHPILRREAIAKFRLHVCSWKSCVPPRCDALPDNRVGAEANIHPNLKTINGHELIPRTGDLQAEHFKNLSNYWDANTIQSTLRTF